MAPTLSLGSRLKAVYRSAARRPNTYSRIWDCCCDHGYLGKQILNDDLCEQVNFVDQVPSITQALTADLVSYPQEKYQVVCQDAANINLCDDENHLLVFAGVGGENCVDIVRSILEKNTQNIDFIFCASTSVHSLREYLSVNNFGLIEESIVGENDRYYEVIYASSVQNKLKPVSTVGAMWDKNNEDHCQYLKNIITLYTTRMMGSRAAKASTVRDAYQQCFDQYYL